MARSHGKITTDIWNDAAFVALDDASQRLYFLLLTQAKLNLAGCLDVLPTRWARLAGNTTVADIGRSLGHLESANFIATDHDTDELVIRTFVRHDITQGGWNRNIAKGLWSAWKSISSPFLRHCVVAHLPDHIWAKDHGVPVPQEAQDLRCRSWIPAAPDVVPTVTSSQPEPQVQSRSEPQLRPRFEPPSTVNPLPSTVSVPQRDVSLQAAAERLAALDQATEMSMDYLGKLTPPGNVRNKGGWIATARAGIRAEIEELQSNSPNSTGAELAGLYCGAGQPVLPADAPRPEPKAHDGCPPPCDGVKGHLILEDGVVPHGCPGPLEAAS